MNKICRGHILRIAVGIMFVITLLVSAASAATPINSCTTISSPGEYVLNQNIKVTQNILGVYAPCIVITSSEVTFDGQGHSIIGPLIMNKPSDVLSGEPGVFVSGSTKFLRNVIVKNLRVQNWPTGVYYDNVQNGMIANIIADHNAAYGIRLANSMNITITNNKAFNNQWVFGGDGILLGLGSNHNILTGNLANSNGINGIYVSHSSNNNLKGNTANSNEIGIDLEQSNNNNLIGNAASFNFYGLELTSANNNLIYNNYFKDRIDVEFDGSNTNNIWNIKKTAGKNIVGGPYLGGNFWANLFGRGFSETCKDADRDGICDSPNRIFGNNIDYLPLSSKFTPTVH